MATKKTTPKETTDAKAPATKKRAAKAEAAPEIEVEAPAPRKTKGTFSAPASGMLCKVFGVRHLSPSAAWHLRNFLNEVDPTAILIEGPSDATSLLPHLAHKKTKPPIAFLAFTKQRPVRSLFYPMASYSPEWEALTWGLQRKRDVRFVDLPASAFLGMKDVDDLPGSPKEAPKDPRPYIEDPYQEIALLSGESDYETWWERNFEHLTEPESYQRAAFHFGAELRQIRTGSKAFEDENLLREAYMRRKIREVIEDGHDPEKIVMVCGAFHASVLTAEEKVMSDAEFKKLPNEDCTITLMPYSYFRLSAQSGYGAGNHAPGYFQMFWEEYFQNPPLGAAMRFLVELAGRQRAAGTIRSSAEVIEAVRLAQALSSMKNAVAPSLADLRDAATIILGQGYQEGLGKFLREIEGGDALGSLPEGVTRTALQDDFYHLIDALHLKDYLKDKEQRIKGHTNKEWLDRRLNRFAKSEDAAARDRNRSIFLHRLQLVGIGFARNVTSSQDREENTFKEVWEARWTPECEINLAEKSLVADTIAGAAAYVLSERLKASKDVGEASRVARLAVECDLPEIMFMAKQRAQALAVDDAGFPSLALASFEFANLVGYKDVTEINVEPLKPLVSEFFLRATLLAHSASKCDDQAARGTWKPSDDEEEEQQEKPPLGIGEGLKLLHDVAIRDGYEQHPLQTERWYQSLDGIAADDSVNAFISGTAAALLLERGKINDEVLDQRVSLRLSPGMDPELGSSFFEGLASRNRMALLSRQALWRSMSNFITSLDDREFKRALASLRRAFSAFNQSEARRVASLLAEIWGRGANEITQAIETKLDDKELEKINEDLGDIGDLDLDL
jgi:hypothetical protein